MPKSPKVRFFFESRVLALGNQHKLKSFIEEIFKSESKILGSLNYIFCSDQYLLKINQEYLQHDDLTDIISFDMSDNKKTIEGEIYISADRVKENAKMLKISSKQELLRVIFHGALHLCGYKDKTKREKEKMRIKEELYLAKYKT